ncbi:MAG: hypothetical protein RL410_948 [Actinomycetota bacterium]|jgi:cell division septum initiation protein DivIVA
MNSSEDSARKRVLDWIGYRKPVTAGAPMTPEQLLAMLDKLQAENEELRNRKDFHELSDEELEALASSTAVTILTTVHKREADAKAAIEELITGAEKRAKSVITATDKQANATIAAADKQAAQTIAKAEKLAAQTVSEAQKKATNTVEVADKQATEILTAAHRDANAAVSAAQKTAAEIDAAARASIKETEAQAAKILADAQAKARQLVTDADSYSAITRSDAAAWAETQRSQAAQWASATIEAGRKESLSIQRELRSAVAASKKTWALIVTTQDEAKAAAERAQEVVQQALEKIDSLEKLENKPTKAKTEK